MVMYIYIPQKNRGTAPPSRPEAAARRFQRRRGLFLEEITGGGRRPSAGRQAASVGESTLSIKHCK